MKYVIKVDYRSGGKAVHADLDEQRAEMGAGAFLRDLFGLEGRGVKQVCVAIQDEKGGDHDDEDVSHG